RVGGDYSLDLGRSLAPPGVGDPVEAVRPQPVTFWNRRMVEVLIGIAHADALHDRSRTCVQHSGVRHDFGKPQLLEADAQRRAGSFARVAATPMGARQ